MKLSSNVAFKIVSNHHGFVDRCSVCPETETIKMLNCRNIEKLKHSTLIKLYNLRPVSY